MKTLIFLPGSISDPFFSKEITYCKKYFDKIYVITYEGNKVEFRELSEKFGFEFKIIKKINFKSLLRTLFSWQKKYPHIGEEYKLLNGPGKIKKLMYCLFYINYAEQAVPFMEGIIRNSKGNVYISSFWLSRTAYAASIMNINRDSKVRRIVSRAHGFDLYKERVDYGYLPFRKFICENLDEIRFISEDGYRYHEENWPDSLAQRSVYYMGSLNEKNIKKEVVEKKIPVIATTAYIRNIKRYDLIIETLSKIKKEFVWYQYGDGELKQEIENNAALKLNHIRYKFKGNVPNNEILNFYKNDDVDYMLNLSDSEGLPVSFMEAMSAGIPVIARNTGGVKEIVNNQNGLLLDIQPDTDLWAREIENELGIRVNNINEYLQKSVNAYSTWKENFDSDENTDKYFKTLSEY